MTKNCAILISGGGSNMVKLLESMKEDGHPARPVLVMSSDPGAAGLMKAVRMGVPIGAVDHRDYGEDRAAFEEKLTQRLEAFETDLICLAGFMRILTPGFVERWAGAMLNIHPSLLPKYRGLRTHARALEAGDHEAGCTVHEVTQELDGGPVLGQARVPVEPEDTPDTLAAKVLAQEHQLYPAVLRRFAAGDRSLIELP